MLENGLYKINGDPHFAAADIGESGTVLFAGQNGRVNRDTATYGCIGDIADNATFIRNNDSTLKEAADAFRQNRKPRWLTPIT